MRNWRRRNRSTKKPFIESIWTLPEAAEDPQFPESVFPASAAAGIHGGRRGRAAKALEWTQRKSPEEIVEFALSLEVNSYDVHLKMEQRMEDPRAKKMFALSRTKRRDTCTACRIFSSA